MNHSFTLFLLIGFLLISCMEQDEGSFPEIISEEVLPLPNSSLLALKKAYQQSGEEIHTFEQHDISMIEAYVISSDDGGNFYKTLVVQNKAVTPSSGIEILINLKAYYTKFDIGRKIYLKTGGLSITESNGKFQLGFLIDNELKPIPESLLDEFIVRSKDKEKIIAMPISISEFSDELLHIFVELTNLQFRKDEVGRTYSGDVFDEYDGERILIQCDNSLMATLSTSTFSRFKSLHIPSSKINAKAVLTKDYYSEKYILSLNSISDIDISEGARCDPIFLDCDGNFSTDNIIFYEDFENINKTKELENLGWTNHSIYFGEEKYKKRSSNGNNALSITAYGSNESNMDVWLITPPIHLDGTNDEILEFETNASYDNGTNLTVWVSSNYEGNIKSAIWDQLDVRIDKGPRNGYGTGYLKSGVISLDCLKGKINIALRYIGSDSGISTTYEIDNIKITGK